MRGEMRLTSPTCPMGRGSRVAGLTDQDPGVDRHMEVVPGAGVIEDGVLYGAEQLMDVLLPHPQHPPDQGVEH